MSLHITDINNDPRVEDLFSAISERNTILFLGAGASVTDDKKYLSRDLIEFYEDKKRIQLGIADITEFVDVISNTPTLTRLEFDIFVDECLRKYRPTDTHRFIASLPWRLIITTNYDLIIESAFRDNEGTPQGTFRLKAVRSKKEYYGVEAADEIKYIKLNGCISDKKQYPLIFSSDDFKRANKYYKNVLNDLKNLSDRVQFLSIGYSYSDDFSKKLLERIDSYGFRERRTIYNIDPYIPDSLLPLYESKKICILKCTYQQFFDRYKKWEVENFNAGRPKVYFNNVNELAITLPINVQQRLDGNLNQLNKNYKSTFIDNIEYYKGQEPDYSIITRHYDVIRDEKIKQTLTAIKTFVDNDNSAIVPIVFFVGAFGSGKSTFAYRLLYTLKTSALFSRAICYEINDPRKLNPVDLKEVFVKSNAEYIFLYLNNIEINSIFKSTLDLRNKLSTDGINGFKVIFIATIRENILLKQLANSPLKSHISLNVDGRLNQKEADDLVEKLVDCGLIAARDYSEKKHFSKKIMTEYHGDSYIALLDMIDGTHAHDLFHAYSQLTKEAQQAFLYTSILHQYKILMPASLLRRLISKDWEHFKVDVIQAEGKGILIQEIGSKSGSEPDLYFRTKHPLIAKKLVNEKIKSKDQLYKFVKEILTHSLTGTKSSETVVNLIKAISIEEDLLTSQIDNLYDTASQTLNEDPYFLLHYSINLQRRGGEVNITNAIKRIIYAESLLNKRNHRLIHRRGVLNFELAKIWYDKETKEINRTYHFLSEARDLLKIKILVDPCSVYGYYDLILLEIWVIEKLNLSEDDALRAKIQVEELFDTAFRAALDSTEKLLVLKNKYIERFQFNNHTSEYLDYLYEYYDSFQTRPYALILLFNYFESVDNFNECEKIIGELEGFKDLEPVLLLLFKFYGRNLNFIHYRLKFFSLVRDNGSLQNDHELRYNYLSYIAESYSKNFKEAQLYLNNIDKTFNYINPDYQQVWLESDTDKAQEFNGQIKISKTKKHVAYIEELHKEILLRDFNKGYNEGQVYKLNLHFYLTGLKAVILGEG